MQLQYRESNDRAFAPRFDEAIKMIEVDTSVTTLDDVLDRLYGRHVCTVADMKTLSINEMEYVKMKRSYDLLDATIYEACLHRWFRIFFSLVPDVTKRFVIIDSYQKAMQYGVLARYFSGHNTLDIAFPPDADVRVEVAYVHDYNNYINEVYGEMRPCLPHLPITPCVKVEDTTYVEDVIEGIQTFASNVDDIFHFVDDTRNTIASMVTVPRYFTSGINERYDAINIFVESDRTITALRYLHFTSTPVSDVATIQLRNCYCNYKGVEMFKVVEHQIGSEVSYFTNCYQSDGKLFLPESEEIKDLDDIDRVKRMFVTKSRRGRRVVVVVKDKVMTVIGANLLCSAYRIQRYTFPVIVFEAEIIHNKMYIYDVMRYGQMRVSDYNFNDRLAFMYQVRFDLFNVSRFMIYVQTYFPLSKKNVHLLDFRDDSSIYLFRANFPYKPGPNSSCFKWRRRVQSIIVDVFCETAVVLLTTAFNSISLIVSREELLLFRNAHQRRCLVKKPDKWEIQCYDIREALSDVDIVDFIALENRRFNTEILLCECKWSAYYQ